MRGRVRQGLKEDRAENLEDVFALEEEMESDVRPVCRAVKSLSHCGAPKE